MSPFEKSIYNFATSQSNVYPKALAYYMFRLIIEGVHTKYNISNDDIKDMCKEAVNCADMFLKIQQDPELYKTFAMWACDSKAWDEPEVTDQLRAELKELKHVAEVIEEK